MPGLKSRKTLWPSSSTLSQCGLWIGREIFNDALDNRLRPALVEAQSYLRIEERELMAGGLN